MAEEEACFSTATIMGTDEGSLFMLRREAYANAHAGAFGLSFGMCCRVCRICLRHSWPHAWLAGHDRFFYACLNDRKNIHRKYSYPHGALTPISRARCACDCADPRLHHHREVALSLRRLAANCIARRGWPPQERTGCAVLSQTVKY